MDKLLKCPFCGGEAEVDCTNQHDKLFVVGCNTPMCYGNINHFTMVFVSEETAIDTWNTRTPMDNIVEKLGEKQYQVNKAAQISESYKDVQAYGGKYLAFSEAINIVKQEINNGLE